MLSDVPEKLFIAGEWVGAAAGRTFAVSDPATGEVLAQVADGGPDDGMRALDAAVDAAENWANTSPRVRADILRRSYDLLQERKDDVALLISLEMGKPLAQSLEEVAYGGEFLRWFAEEAVRVSGRYGDSPNGNGTMVVSKRPVGPCYLITPWNFPLAMATRKVAPALAAGCTVVLKPAELTPLTTLMFTKLMQDAGLPSGVLNIITTTKPAALSDVLLADPRLRKLSFTGSTQVGRTLLAKAAGSVLRTSMELGGNAPFVVFEDADLDKAVDAAMIAKFRNIGQACTAANRFIVHRSVAEQFTEQLRVKVDGLCLGHGTNPDATVGPLINEGAIEKVDALVRGALSEGAKLVCGGDRLDGPGSFYQPTILRDVPPEAEILQKEIFGPVVTVVEFEGEDEAVRLANDTEFGLMAYVFTQNLARGQRMIDRLETGMMGVNVGVASQAAAPFGGIKQSGLGREGGPDGIDEYLSTKYTLISHD